MRDLLHAEFEADIDPQNGWPRLRFNFVNGWSASLVLRASFDRTTAMQASIAACPTGAWGTGVTELGPTEASADEAVAWLAAVQRRPWGGQ